MKWYKIIGWGNWLNFSQIHQQMVAICLKTVFGEWEFRIEHLGHVESSLGNIP